MTEPLQLPLHLLAGWRSFGGRDLAKTIASIMGDEPMRWPVLRQALDENPVPESFIS